MLDEHHGTTVVSRRRARTARRRRRRRGDHLDHRRRCWRCWVGDCAAIVLIGCDRELAVRRTPDGAGSAAGVRRPTRRRDASTSRSSLALLGPCIGAVLLRVRGRRPGRRSRPASTRPSMRRRHAPPPAVRARCRRGASRRRAGASRRRGHGARRRAPAAPTTASRHRVARRPRAARGRRLASKRERGGERPVTIDPRVVASRWPRCRARITSAAGDESVVDCSRSRRAFGPEAIDAALAAGCTRDRRELRPGAGRQARRRAAAAEVHFIGQLQTNKVRQIAGLVQVYETVDRARLVARDRPTRPRRRRARPGRHHRGAGKGGCPLDAARRAGGRSIGAGLDLRGSDDRRPDRGWRRVGSRAGSGASAPRSTDSA